MEIFQTIAPIFLIIALGGFARKRGFLPPEFLGPANRLVYFIAIPALIFRATSRAPIERHFHFGAIVATLAAAVAGYGLAWIVSRRRAMDDPRAATFIQSAGHGNLGYIGLSVALYFLGDEGLVRAGIIAGFLIILQNFLSVLALQIHGAGGAAALRPGAMAAKVFGNPIIASAMAGIFVSSAGIPVPVILRRSLDMVAGLGPPTALLLIGGSLSLSGMRRDLLPALGAVGIKLLLLPAAGMILFHRLGVPAADYLPGLILLATPTATVAYVMAREMNGDPDFAVATISASTLLSAGTLFLWLATAQFLG
jgi:malate permease and related proteins